MTSSLRNASAVLVMDFQSEIVAMLGDAASSVIDHAAAVVKAARAAKIPVIYVVVGFRPGYPEIGPTSRWFAMVAQSGRFASSDRPGSDVHPKLKPEESDVVIVKHRVSAFAHTDLDLILRAKSIDTLILTGIATSGVVLSTTRHAADADYKIVVVNDACADGDAEVHRVLTEKVLARQATVLSSVEVVEAMARAPEGK
jgi:nicotinamidase-related amidase